MPKVTFNKRAVYGGVMHPAGTPFEVAEKDLEGIKELGGFVVGEQEEVKEDVLNLEEIDFDNLDALDVKQLRAIAAELGIKLAGNASRKKATDAILEVIANLDGADIDEDEDLEDEDHEDAEDAENEE